MDKKISYRKAFKTTFECIMVALLFYITYSRLMKLLSDETTLSQSFQNEVELPSFTICPR